MADFERYDAQVLGISVDSVPSHVAFAKSLGGIERYPLLADFHPKGEVARRFGVYNEERGVSRRALVMIGPDLEVKWSYTSPSPLEIPGANLIFDALEAHAAA